MLLLILGGSGGVGLHLVSQAVARGHAVRAVVRPGAVVSEDPRVTWIRGEVLDPRTVAAAVDGVDAVVSSLGSKRWTPANPWSALASPADFAERVARNLVAAAPRRLIAVSAAGVGDSYVGLNLAMRAFLATSTIGAQYADLTRMEAVLASSNLDWMAVRPVTLTRGPRTGRVAVIDGFPWTATIARADVAAWMLDRAEDGRTQPRTPILAAA